MDNSLYIKVLHQVLSKMDNEFLQEKYKAYQMTLRKSQQKV